MNELSAVHTSQGTIAATAIVSLDPDRSGNFVGDGTADDVEINAAIAYMVALGGGECVLLHGDWQLTATVNVPVNVFLRGVGWETVLNYDAGGNCITITGDNVKLRDFKVVIVVGAGGVGTRPNAIYATGRTNVEISNLWLYGDTVTAPDGDDSRQCGIVFLINMVDSKIIFCTIENWERNGISFVGTSGNEHTDIEIEGNNLKGTFVVVAIRLTYVIDSTLTGNICRSGVVNNIALSSCDGNTLTGNNCEGSLNCGIQLSVTLNTTLVGNTCKGNGTHGILLTSTSVDNTLTGNTCNGNSDNGIYVNNSDYNTLTGNTCNKNTEHGIKVDDAEENTLVGNTCNENDSGDTGSFDGINITDASLDNLIHSNTCNNNDRYGINIDDVNALRNWVKNNQLRGNTSGPFQDLGTDTKLATYPIQLIQGTTFISAAGSAWGWEIDADTEFALGIDWLPLELQQIVRIRIIAVGLAAPGAGNEMRAQFTGEAATFDEVFTTHSIDVVDLDSEETNFGVNDVIHWILDATNDADIANIVGGDRLQLKVLHEGAGGGSIETDAVFSSIAVEYV